MANILNSINLGASFIVCTLIFGTALAAESIEFQCVSHDMGAPTDATTGKPFDLKLSYEEDAEGTLTVTGSFGAFSLPASKQEAEGAVEGVNNGKKYNGVGIRAQGPALIFMPDKAAIEACVQAKTKPDDPNYADLTFMAALSCTASTAMGTTKVPVTASVEIAMTQMQSDRWEIQTVYMKRSFDEPSTLPGGKIIIESNPTCEIFHM